VASPPLPFRGRIVDVENGYEITLHEDWVRIATDPEERDEMYAELDDVENLELAVTILDAALPNMDELGISVLAVDTPAFQSNLNVIAGSAFGSSLDDFDNLNQAELRAYLGITGRIAKERYMLPGGETVRLSYQYPLGEGFGKALARQYFFVIGGNSYVLTFVGPIRSRTYLTTAESMAESFRTL